MDLDITIPVTTAISNSRLKRNPFLILICTEGKPVILDAYETKEQAVEVNKIVKGVIMTNPYYVIDTVKEEVDDEEQSPMSYYQT